jgi:threonine/homoserine/homoserine lactone efflux protein
MTHHQWLVFLPAAIFVAASPGAGNFLALSNGLRGGLRPAILALSGRCAAFVILIVLVMAGVGALLSASAIAFTILKWAGVAYLIWLGVRAWRSDALPVTEAPETVNFSWRLLMVREFTVAITNPKAILLFTAFLPQFVVPAQPMVPQFMTLGAAYVLIEVLAASGYALAGSRIQRLRLTRGGVRRVNRLSAIFMFLAAGWLATMKRSA